jgi:hypothetical protein
LFVCGGASAFLSILAFIIDLGGLFGGHKARATAIAGLALGLIGVCMFLLFLYLIARGG